MPTMSSSFFQPAVTPCTALNTSARVSPCTAACLSLARFTCKTPSLVSSEIPSATSAETLPLGPSTRTVLPSTLYLTPAGSGISFLPIRDIDSILLELACESRPSNLAGAFHCSPYNRGSEMRGHWLLGAPLLIDTGERFNPGKTDPCWPPLPHFAQQLAAHAFSARLAARHHALGRGHNGDAKAALDALDLVAADVDAAAGTRDARQVANCRFRAAILQVY